MAYFVLSSSGEESLNKFLSPDLDPDLYIPGHYCDESKFRLPVIKLSIFSFEFPPKTE